MKALHYQTQKEQNNLEERLTQEEVCQYFTNLRAGSRVRIRGGRAAMQREKVTSPRPIRLPRSRLLDVTERSPKRTFGETLRDIQKTAAWETIGPLAAKNFPRTRTIEPARRLVLHCFRF